MAVLLIYLILNIFYNKYLKKMVGVDVIVLACFYCLRIYAGSELTQVPISNWFLLFAIFVFTGLAFAKRYSELLATEEKGAIGGKGYFSSDAGTTLVLGIAASLNSILVFMLYLQDPKIQAHFSHPNRLWLIAPGLMYFFSFFWLAASRGQIDGDPIVFLFKRKEIFGVILVLAIIYGISI